MKSLMLAAAAALVLLATTPAHAFRSTSSESFTDPDFTGYKPARVLIVVENASNEMRPQIEERIATQLAKRSVDTVPFRKLFPPTREWTSEAQAERLAENKVDAVLVITVGASAKSVIPVMTHTNTTTNANVDAYGNHASGTATSSSTTAPIYSAKSSADFSAILRDVASGKVAWYADVLVKSSGTLFVGEKGDARGVVGEIIDAMERDGHLVGK